MGLKETPCVFVAGGTKVLFNLLFPKWRSGRFETVYWVWCQNWKLQGCNANWIFLGLSMSGVMKTELEIWDQRMPGGNVALFCNCIHDIYILTSRKGPWLRCTWSLWTQNSIRKARQAQPKCQQGVGSVVASLSITRTGILHGLNWQCDVYGVWKKRYSFECEGKTHFRCRSTKPAFVSIDTSCICSCLGTGQPLKT